MQTDTHPPNHIPLLSKCDLSIRKSIWQASRPWFGSFPGRSLFMKRSHRQWSQETKCPLQFVRFLLPISIVNLGGLSRNRREQICKTPADHDRECSAFFLALHASSISLPGPVNYAITQNA